MGRRRPLLARRFPDHLRRMYGVEVRHPGRILFEDFLPAMGISLAAAGRLIGVSHTTIYELLHGQYDVSPMMALRLGNERHDHISVA